MNNPKPSLLVCKFGPSLINVVLYQRMLIEQRNDIHLNVARCLQHNKFSYMSQKDEIRLLNMHLKITEKSIINYMEENDDDKENKDKVMKESFNLNNLKIYYVKELCERLKSNDLRYNIDDEGNKGSISYIKCGEIYKKSDTGISWER